MIDCLDLGCGTCASTVWAKHAFGWETQLGLTNRQFEVDESLANGYNVKLQDVSSGELFVPCRYVVSFHCLEHLSSKEDVYLVMQKAVSSATDFVFVKVPFFEPQKIEELKRLGLRLTWTNWTGHKTHITADMFSDILNRIGVNGIVDHLIPLPTTIAECVVPYDSPVDTVRYTESLGERKFSELDGFYLETYCFVPLAPEAYHTFERIIDRKNKKGLL